MTQEAARQPGSSEQDLRLNRTARKRGWILILIGILLVHLITSNLVSTGLPVNVNLYVIQPVLWLALAWWTCFVCGLSWRRLWKRMDRQLVLLAVLIGMFQLSVFMLAGVLAGFGYSPYSHRGDLAILNGVYFFSRLVGLEFGRWGLLISLKRYNRLLALGLAWITITLVELPLSRLWLAPFSNPGEGFVFFGNQVLPVAAQNILATYLAFIAGPFASLGYRGVLAAFEWYSPVLPDLPWTLNAFLGTVTPMLGVLAFREGSDWKAQQREAVEERREPFGLGWIIPSLLVVMLLWFNSGLFGVKPTLISGISMEPMLHTGDIVITREVQASEVKVGDVVLFHDGNVSILHRVTRIDRNPNGLIFTTQGDNVAISDEPWEESQLKGGLVFVVPKLGWISIWMKQLIQGTF